MNRTGQRGAWWRVLVDVLGVGWL